MATDHDFKIKNGAQIENGFLLIGKEALSNSDGYMGMKTSNMTGVSDYMIISGTGDNNTYLSAKDGASVYIRGGGNASGHQLQINSSQALFHGVVNLSSNSSLRVSGTTVLTSARNLTNIHDITFDGVARSTNNANVDGPNFNVSTTNKDTAEYAYRVDRSGTVKGGITINGTFKSTTGIDLTEDSAAYISLNRSAFITFYGNANSHHAIGSRNESGAASDDLRINSYAALHINLDSNNNNTSSANFTIGKHGGGTGTISNLFTVSGEDGTTTVPYVRITGTGDAALASTTHGLQIGSTSGNNVIIDDNEVMARNNGSAGTLYLQADGGTVSIGGSTAANLTVTGSLTVQGTTTTLNTANLNVEDKNITLNYSTGDSSSSANGAGITIQDAVDSSTDATILWDATNDEFDFSHTITLPQNKFIHFGTSAWKIGANGNDLNIFSSDDVNLYAGWQRFYYSNVEYARIGSSGGNWVTGNTEIKTGNLTVSGTISSGTITSTGNIVGVGINSTSNYTEIGTTSSSNLVFKRNNASYIQADQTSGYFIFITNGRSTSYANRALSLTADNNAEFGNNTNAVGNMQAATGNTTGKFAVKSTGVHASYDFYNNGTTYLNGSTTVDDVLDITGSSASLRIGGTEVISTSRNLANIGTITNSGKISSSIGSNATYSRPLLEITSSATPTQIKITTNILYSGTGASTHAHSVRISGFQYGSAQMADLQIGWHVYNNEFYNRSVVSSGSWAPTVTLAVENNKVVIHLASPGYWPKLYVESMYNAYGGAGQASGWSWSDAAISADSGTPNQTVPYKSDFGNNVKIDSSGNFKVGNSTVINSSRELHNLNGNIRSNNTFQFLNMGGSAAHIRTRSVFAGTSYGDTPPDGSVNAVNTYEQNGTTVIDNSRNLVNIGTISSGAITANGGGDQSVIKSSSDAPLVVESTDAYSGINFKDTGGNSSMFYHGGSDHLYLHSATFAVAGSTLATGYEFQVNGDANLTGSLAFGGATAIDGSRNATLGTISSGAITSSADLTLSGNDTEIRFTGGNNRILFSGYRALEGSTNGGILQVGEGYTTVQSYGDLNLTSGHSYKTNGTTRINSVGDGLFTSLYIGSTNIVDTSRNLANIGTISSGAITSSGDVKLNGSTVKYAAPVYRNSVSGISNSGYTTLFTVTGSALASTIRMTLAGTTGSVVVNLTADISVGHYQDILITSRSAFYTTVTLKITSDNNEDFAVEATTNSANAVTLAVEVFPLNNETVTFASSHSFTGQSHTHTCSYGVATSGAGGNSGDHRTRGRHYISDGSAASPSLVFENDHNTGLYRVGSDSMGWVVGGSRKFYTNASRAYFQNLSEGVDVPSLRISGTTVIDSSRNLTNIGTISSGAITSSGAIMTTQEGASSLKSRFLMGKASGSTADGELYLQYGSSNRVYIGAGSGGAGLTVAGTLSSGAITSTGLVSGTAFVGGLYGGATGAPDARIWAVSADYPNYGIFYNEGNPDTIEFKWNNVVKAYINMETGLIDSDTGFSVGGSTVINSSGQFTGGLNPSSLSIGGTTTIDSSRNLTNINTLELKASNSSNKWVAYTYTDNTYRINYNGAGADEFIIDSDGRVGIGTNSLSSSYKLNVSGNIDMNNSHIHYVNELHFNGNTRFKSHNTSTTLHRSGHSTSSSIAFDTNGTIRGYVGGNSDSGHSVGLFDQGGNWGVRHINDQGTIFYSDNGAEQARIGTDLVDGDYGGMVIKSAKNGWSGYSINNRSVFMHDNSNTTGIYNDVDNEWFAQFQRNGSSYIYTNGHATLQTLTSGIQVNSSSGESTSQVRMYTNGTIRGYFYADTGNNIGILDAGGDWAILHKNDQGTEFRTDGSTVRAAIGADLVGGDYGSMVVKEYRSSWAGYSIDNNWVFMSNTNGSEAGIYNDINNQWAVRVTQQQQVDLFHNGNKKLETTSTGIDVTGNITHDGLTMTSGTDIDQLYTSTESLTITTSWQDTSINSSELATGTYIMQMYASDHSNGGHHYTEYYSGVISWYGAGTNSAEVDEIVLHRAGHAPNAGVIHLRTQRHASGGDNLVLQIKANYTRTAASNYTFKFRRMI